MKHLAWWLILIIIIARLSSFLVSNQNFFTRKFDLPYLSDVYSKSQYVVGAASQGGIGDDGLYSFAGYYYVFQRGDVSAVDFTHPPLGKYLIGLSILLFQNENIINIIYFSILLLTTYKIGKMILKNSLLSLIAIAILSFDPLFLDHLLRSLLDLPFTLFFMLAVYFFLLGLNKSKYYYLSMLFWGMSFSTRFFPSLVIIYAYLFLTIFFYKRKNLPVFLAASLFIPLVYIIAHISFFVYHPSIIEFLRHKKWMVAWFTGSVRIFGNIWRNIFSGYYLNPTYKLIKNEHWSILVPFVMVFSLIPVTKFINKKHMTVLVLYGLSVLYLVYVTILTDGNEKFIMPIYPILCVLAVNNISALYSIIGSWKKRK